MCLLCFLQENGTVDVAVFNQDKEKDAEKQRQTLKSEKEALLIGMPGKSKTPESTGIHRFIEALLLLMIQYYMHNYS